MQTRETKKIQNKNYQKSNFITKIVLLTDEQKIQFFEIVEIENLEERRLNRM